MTSSTANRDTCGACERDDSLDPHTNPAGLQAIAYRIGTHGRFLSRMKAWISRQTVLANVPGEVEASVRPLEGLTTRSPDDPVLALMDAWACSLDVLTFYQERIANEGFLRTAVERRSVLALARSIGYELDPGVAASTRLSFTLLDTPKAPSEVTLSTGLQIQSVPGPGELPQTFETVEEIVARPEWNAMRPAQREPQVLLRDDHELYLAGLSTGLRVGSKVLIVGEERLGAPESSVWGFRTVVELALDKDASVTWVRVDDGDGWSGFGGRRTNDPPAEPRAYAFSRRLDVFGHSAPDPRMFSADMAVTLADYLDKDNEGNVTEWTDFNVFSTGPKLVHLVGKIDDLVPNTWLVFEDEAHVQPCIATQVAASGRTDFSLSLDTTLVTLDTDMTLVPFSPRTVTVHAQSRELTLATRPITGDSSGAGAAVEGDEIVLDDELTLLPAGRAVLVTGPLEGSDSGDDIEEVVEVAIVAEAAIALRHGDTRTVLKLTSALANRFDRARALVLGNVARATHGKAVVGEVLGSGDGSKAFQSFALRQNPLTYVSSTSGGTASTLTVRVGGVAWTPASSTFELGPDDQVYVPRIDDEGVTTILFGDGRNGARLPGGRENVTADYRAGTGSAGAVAAGKLTILKTRPQGVKAVTNPQQATGAEDAEPIDDARDNAPVTVLTLDRLVSVRDYQDYARAYPGIGKAQSVRLWDGRRWWVHLTLATSEGQPLASTDDLHRSLTADIDAHRDPVQRVRFDTFSARSFKLRGTVIVDPAHVAEDVLAAITTTLRDAFSFAERSFGQPVTGAEILKLAHGVAGVIAVDLDALWFADQTEPPLTAVSPASWVLPALGARWGVGGVQRAELLLLDDSDGAVNLEEATS